MCIEREGVVYSDMYLSDLKEAKLILGLTDTLVTC